MSDKLFLLRPPNKEGFIALDAFTGSAGTPPAESGDPVKAQNHIRRLRDNQNFGGALAGGLLGAVTGAALWAVITELTKFHIGSLDAPSRSIVPREPGPPRR